MGAFEEYELRDVAAPEHVVIREQKEEFAGPIFRIRNDEIEFASADVARRQYMLHHNAVGIVALRAASCRDSVTDKPGNSVTDKDCAASEDSAHSPITLDNAEILLIRQYRHPVRSILWEIPAGLRDHENEDPLLAAQRELAEETDLQADSWQQSVSYLSSPGCSTENLDIFIAQGVHSLNPQEGATAGFERREEEREIVAAWWPLESVYRAVMRRELRSPSLVLGVLAARSALAEGTLRDTMHT